MAGTDFCLLGPLLVRSGGVAVPVRRGKQRAVLAALLLSGGRVVSLDDLAEILWGPGPPPSARVTIQNYVMRLRQALGDTHGSRISTQPRGYLIRVDPGELDVTWFESLLGTARKAARDGSWDTAATRSRDALSLWRGEPLSDAGSEVLTAREVPRLVELRLQALEVRFDADLHLGRQAEVITELRQLVSGHPLREHLHGLLMLALYRDGRQAEALAAYQDARRILAEELGTEPGTGLRELHQRMLAGDLTLDAPVPAPPVPAPPAPGPAVPRELPARVAHFTGRGSELAALSRLLDTSGAQMAETVVISAIGGTAGVGKTALAVHWAHQAAGRFPDGQLYVNLRGYDPAQPAVPTDVLAGFLRSLGVADQDIPVEEAERAARYRSLLTGKRMLVVLDNAGSAEQVRPLLPGDPACTVVVTSRDVLTGLVARDGARRLDLDLLPLRDAVGLLRALIGGRVDADPAAAAVLASQCGRLPLALRVAAELAAGHPAVRLAELAGELADRQRRLDLLDAHGDPRCAVRTVFSWSYQDLDTGAARAFRLLGLHPGPDFDVYAATALTGSTVAGAGQLLDQLARAHLIQLARPGRYGMHDLLRAYAGELAAGQDAEAEQRTALTRLFDYYLHTAAAAMDTLHPAEHHRRPRIPAPATPLTTLATPAAARAWLGTELLNLVAVAAHTAEHGWPGHTTRLAVILFRYLDIGGRFAEAATVQGHALRAARRGGDHAAEATALTSLGAVDMRQGRYDQAADRYQEAVILFRKAGDLTGEARAIGNLGALDMQQGRYQEASGYLQQALTLHRETGDRSGEAHTSSNLGLLELRRGRYREASGYLRQALGLCRETGYQAGEIHVLCNLGAIGLRQGRHQEASGYLQRALALCRETGDRTGEAEALNSLGEVFLATGQPGLATARHTAALGLADQATDEYEQARAHDGLARACQATGDHGQARRHWREALALYETLGAPEAGQVHALLDSAAEDTGLARPGIC
jgi:DNA-binding SARP family transcriptional activator/Tfp pilus assembly protein PilF